jgi:oligopeptide transport system permease protein
MILIIGTVYGAISGYFGGRVDNIMMRFVEILYAIPVTLMVILFMVVLKRPLEEAFTGNTFLKSLSIIGPGLVSIFITLSVFYWVGMARIVRGQVLSLKEQEYVTAARALGASHSRIIFKHLIPNCLGPIIVTTTLQIPSAIFTEAFLSFIGLGVDAPMASLGSLTSSAISGIYSYPYLLIFPASFISIIILAFNLFGDGLRDALDPRMRK